MSKNPKVKIDPAFLRAILPTMRARNARRIVTRSGRRSRGYFPSLKSSIPVGYESQLELASCRVMEVSAVADRIGTQPARLRIEVDGEDGFSYTPDLFFVTKWRETVVGEVKPDTKFLCPDVTERLRRVTERFCAEGMLFIILLESDLKPDPGFQDDLAKVLHKRPWHKPRPGDGNADADAAEPAAEQFSDDAWARAQAICDDLLQRVMDRSFADTIEAATAALEI